MTKGWYGNKQAHSLASKGIRTANGYNKYAQLGQRGETEEYPNGIFNKNGTIGHEVTDVVGGVWVTFEDANGNFVRDFWFDNQLTEKRLESRGISINQKKLNRKVAEEIVKFLRIHHLGGDLRIYFNDMAYNVNYKGNVEIIYDVKASDYFDYANNDTISMSFEGDFYSVMNGYGKYNWDIQEEFSKILEKHGYYHELGNAWNLALYK